MNIMQVVGDNVRFIRQKRKMTLDDMSFLTKMSKTFISDIERSVKVASIISIEKIAKALKVEPSVLMTKDAYRDIEG
jgi:transcriptional regulator with XRE-family HTH domain